MITRKNIFRERDQNHKFLNYCRINDEEWKKQKRKKNNTKWFLLLLHEYIYIYMCVWYWWVLWSIRESKRQYQVVKYLSMWCPIWFGKSLAFSLFSGYFCIVACVWYNTLHEHQATIYFRWLWLSMKTNKHRFY